MSHLLSFFLISTCNVLTIFFLGKNISHQDCHTAQEARAAQRAKFVKKVHKPPLGVNVIDFELRPKNLS